MRKEKNTIEQFRDRLISQYNQNRPNTDQVSRWFMIVVAVFISLLLWFTLNMRKSYTYAVSLPVVLQELPEGYIPLNSFPKEIQVEVSGVGWQLLQLSQQPPPIGVDVKNVGSARRIDFQKLIQPRQFPIGVSIVKITPAQTILELDRKATKRVPVHFRGKISFSTTYEAVRKPIFEPAYVTVVGPEQILRNLSAWPMKEQNFKNVRASINEMVQLSDTLSGLVESNISDVALIVPVEQFTESSRSLRVEVTDLPANVSRVQFNPPQVEVVYRVPVSQFKQAEESEGFRAYVSYDRIAADYSDGTVTATIETPKGLNVRLSRVIHRKLSYFIVRDEGN